MLKYLFIFFDTLDSWINEIEYRFGNFIDPPLPFEEGDDTEKWCQKITAQQAYRYAKYMHSRWRSTRELAENADLSTYKLKKDKKLLREFCDAIITRGNYLEDLYRRMYQRKLSEDSK